MASRPTLTSASTSSRAGAAVTTTSTSNVRRNLFHHSLSRRPTGHLKPSAISTSSTTQEPTIHDESAEIVVKDCNGNYQVTVPTLPPMDEEGVNEEEAAGEKEKMEARLLDMLRDGNVQAGEPLVPELLAAVQASLRRKVASLDEDNWMFDAEHGTPDG